VQIARAIVAALFIAAGLNHFLSPAPYVAIVPSFLPSAKALVYISGAAEIAGGVGILFRATRRIAGFGLIALLIAVFPANIYAAWHGMQIGGRALPEWILWARLPFQPVFMALVYLVALRNPRQPRSVTRR
jgi:uncharacterized membrane protein